MKKLEEKFYLRNAHATDEETFDKIIEVYQDTKTGEYYFKDNAGKWIKIQPCSDCSFIYSTGDKTFEIVAESVVISR